ncbi:MAG: hypothetical protein IT178_01205 [Acidobacteria bacterium]|nr:hypothetical protein [Acidobacteriota bacterium]
MRCTSVALLLVGLSITPVPLHAQTGASARCYSEQPVRSWTDLRVITSCVDKGETHLTTTTTSATGRIVVLVRGLNEYRRLFDDPESRMDGRWDPSKLILYVDDRPVPQFTGTLPAIGHSHVTFDLADLAYRKGAHPDSVAAWKVLLTDGFRDRRMALSVGFGTGGPLPSDVKGFEVDAIQTGWLVSWGVFVALLFALLVVAGRRSDMLRVPGPLAPGQPANTRKAYGLARLQMAAWFFVVLVSFVFIYVVTNSLDSLTPTVIGLMGISAATGLAATVIDHPDTAPATQGFLTDILQEGTGASLPRLQMAVWTIVLILIFGRAISRTLVMPEFSATLLGLMGISGGTYVGFKLPDGKP